MLAQERLIQKVKEQAAADSRVRAVLMYGSFTQGCGDKFSDVEFYIYIENDAFTEFDREMWVAAVHPFYRFFFNEFGTQVAVFTNLVRGEFHFCTQDGMEKIATWVSMGYFPHPDAMCLFDRDGSLARHLQVLRQPAEEGGLQESAQFVADNLINNMVFGVNVLNRGETARSLELLWYVQRYFLQLVRLMDGNMDHFINPTKNLEREIDEAVYENYRGMTAPLNAGSLQQAYSAALRNFSGLKDGLEQKGIVVQMPDALLNGLKGLLGE
ncbi:lincosamide nucleotidyltransferase Lnu(B) [Christensenellaceae bacterium OttesenSCG-928-K19]|nr:lincosamide nucleotidyltransferase Lnu(B) [Christensenellaceae bacterium OttesenSCG-928-K19]